MKKEEKKIDFVLLLSQNFPVTGWRDPRAFFGLLYKGSIELHE